LAFPEQENKNTSKTPNLLHRDGIFYFYCRIPSHLQHYFPPTENGNFQKHIKRTLRTKIESIALERIISYNYQYSELIKLLEMNSMSSEIKRDKIRLFGFRYPNDEPETHIHIEKPTPKSKQFLLSQLIELYLKVRSGSWEGKGPQLVHHSLKLVIYILGDIPIIEIDRQKCRDVRDKLYKLPSNMFYKPELTGISLEEALQLVKNETFEPTAETSVIKHMTWFSNALKFAVDEGKISRNVCVGIMTEGLKIEKKTRGRSRDDLKKNARIPYTNQDINHLLENLQFDKNRSDRFWTFFISLYCGLRINEICQLYVEDIYQKDDIWVIDINANYKDKRCKTDAGMRIVPIHSALIEMGFLWFVASVKKRGYERIFYHLKYNKKDGYKRPAGNYWSRINKIVTGGFKVSKKSFHSLRHNFVNCLKQARVFEPVAANIVGHAADESFTYNTYGVDYSTSVNKEAIELVHYDCIDLVALRKHFFPSLDANYRPYTPGAENEF
jgi:integrase